MQIKTSEKMYQAKIKAIQLYIIKTLLFLSIFPEQNDSLIITSVLAGDKKFKTVSFDTMLMKPLTFEKDLPTTQFRRYRVVRPPKFDIDVNIPIKLPLEDEYPQEEALKGKPVTKDIYFSTDVENGPEMYGKDEQKYAASNLQARYQKVPELSHRTDFAGNHFYATQEQQPQFYRAADTTNAQQMKQTQGTSDADEQLEAHQSNSYGVSQNEYDDKYQYEKFVPGGYVNLQLKGPEGGPKMTYADIDREKWAQQLSNTPDAMPYPILNYHQLQNFYGGLGTFTNGLNDRYVPESSILEKLKSSLGHLTSKFHIGRR